MRSRASRRRTADAETRAAYTGYVDAASYVLQLSDDTNFRYENSLVRALHYMLLKHDRRSVPVDGAKGRSTSIATKPVSGSTRAPISTIVPSLMDEYIAQFAAGDTTHPMVQGAMAHLNLAMIHPFRDGNGRMARIMQTLVLARQQVVYPPFWGIEEYVGENTDDYYRILGEVGLGSWHPERDAREWLRWVLRAHFHQAILLERRTDEARRRWEALSDELESRHLPERAMVAVFNAALGLRVRNAYYRNAAEVNEATATRDLKGLTDTGLLVGNGPRKGRFYVASPTLLAIETALRSRRDPIPDPFEER